MTGAATTTKRPAARDWRDPVVLLLALTPLLFALMTWPLGETLWRAVLRTFSLPVVAIELAVIVAGMVAGRSPLDALRRLPRWVLLVLAGLLLIDWATALLVAPQAAVATIRAAHNLVHLLFAFAIIEWMRADGTRAERSLWTAIIAGLLLYLVALVLLVAIVGARQGFDWYQLGLGVTNVRQLGFYSAVGAAAAIGLAAERRGRGFAIAVAAAVPMMALSYWSATRGSILAVATAVAVGWFCVPALRSWRAFAALIIANVGGILLSLLHAAPDPHYGMFRFSDILSETAPNEVAGDRLNQWAGTLRAVMERPLFGYGESQYRTVVPEALDTFNHPHNIFLQVLLQWGLVGFVGFCLLAVYTGLDMWRGGQRGGQGAASAFLVAASLAVMALYEGPLYHPWPTMMFVVAGAFLIARRPPATTG